MKTVLTFGTFDLFHPGHEFFLREAAKHGDHVVVIIARDTNVERIKGRVPIDDEHKRLKNVRHFVEICRDMSLQNGIDVRLGYQEWGERLKVLDDVQPDVICLGYDQKAHIPEGPWEVIRIGAFHPDKYKSSIKRQIVNRL